MNLRPGPNDLHFSTLVGTAFPRGEKFVFLPEEGSQLLRLELISSHLVEAIRLVSRDKRGQEKLWQINGGSQGTWQSVPFHTNLVGLGGQSGWYVDALRFHLADGSETPLFGGTGGDLSFKLCLHQKQGVWQGTTVGLWGYADETGLEALGFIFWSVEL